VVDFCGEILVVQFSTFSSGAGADKILYFCGIRIGIYLDHLVLDNIK